MKTETKITANVDKLQFEYWGNTGCKQALVPKIVGHRVPTASIEEAAVHLKCSEELLTELVLLVNNITKMVGDDLKDIWERLEYLNKKL